LNYPPLRKYADTQQSSEILKIRLKTVNTKQQH
jgi:hypothetical protein